MIKNKQAGNTLIFVLVILLLITIIGTWAIRGAITSLNITTNAQAQALLVQNSDAVFFQLESYADHAVKIAKLQLDNGMIGYVNKPENKGKLVFYAGMDKVKFKKQVVPGDQLVMTAKFVKRRGTIAVVEAKAEVDGKLAASGTLTFAIGS